MTAFQIDQAHYFSDSGMGETTSISASRAAIAGEASPLNSAPAGPASRLPRAVSCETERSINNIALSILPVPGADSGEPEVPRGRATSQIGPAIYR